MKILATKKVFSKNPYPGKFIVFEGVDGSGQTTQSKKLSNFLKKKGYKVFLTKEPTPNSKFGKQIRKILDKKEKISPFNLQKFFVKDRSWHLKNEVIPALKKSKIVICDRYLFSTLAYGAGVNKLSMKKLIALNKNFLLPDFTFYIDVEPKIALKRIIKRGEGQTLFEKEEKLKRVRRVFKNLLKKYKIIALNGEESRSKIFKKVKNKIET